MKTKLIQTKDYLLLIDEEAEIISQEGLYTDGINIFSLVFYPEMVLGKIIAYRELNEEAKELDLPKLPPFEEKPLMEQATKLREERGYHKDSHYSFCGGFIEGYKAAQSKQFSLEDMEKAIDMAKGLDIKTGVWFTSNRYTKEEIIQSLSTQQLPSEFIPEYEYYYHSSEEFYKDAKFEKCSKEQYDSIKKEIPTCPVKVKLQTITNSEGKEEIVGSYKY